MIEVVKAGLLDLVMDLGRPGFRVQGVPEGGAADAPALILANRLVGNADDAAGFELLLQGPTLFFPRGGRVAMIGADMGARLDGVPVPTGRPQEIAPGGRLELGLAEAGLRTYLAVAGEIQVPAVLGSRSTFLPGGFGGWQGRALRAGDMLPIGDPVAPRPASYAQAGRVPSCLRILPGPQLAGFSDGALHALTEAVFSLSADSNRLGLRLSGPALDYAGGELPSQAVLPGAIQVPPDGQAIILGWDGPVTGGYPVIGGIIAADLHLLAQLRPGDKLNFRFITAGEARDAWHQHQASLNGAIAWDA